MGYAAVSPTEVVRKSLPKYATVFTAELSAIQESLEIIGKQQTSTKFCIFSDSKSALNAIERYEPTNYIVYEIINSIHSLQTHSAKHITFCWVPSHVGLAGNEFADQAAKEAANVPPRDIVVPPNDYIPAVIKAMKEKWQRTWNAVDEGNKLKKIKAQVDEWKSSSNENRRIEVIMTRLRIGHTNLTHAYLMSMPHGPIPVCERCGARQSITHLFMQCPRLKRTRERYFGKKELREILGDTEENSINKVITYLQEIEVLNKI